MDAEQPRVALIGYGAIADLHAAALNACGANVVLVAGPDSEEGREFAARHSIGRFEADASAAWTDPSVDAVVVASPSQVHAAQARAALEQGRHVLCEIPFALSLAEAEELVQLADSTARTLMTCHTLRYTEPYSVIRTLIAAEQMAVRHISARTMIRRWTNVGWTGRQRDWTDNLLWHQGGHLVDMVLAIAGSPVTRVRASVGAERPSAAGVMDVVIGLDFANQAVASIELSYNSLLPRSDLLVVCDEEAMAVAGYQLDLGTRDYVNQHSTSEVERIAVVAQDAAFLAAVRDGRQPDAACRRVLPAMAVLQEVQDLIGS